MQGSYLFSFWIFFNNKLPDIPILISEKELKDSVLEILLSSIIF